FIAISSAYKIRKHCFVVAKFHFVIVEFDHCVHLQETHEANALRFLDEVDVKEGPTLELRDIPGKLDGEMHVLGVVNPKELGPNQEIHLPDDAFNGCITDVLH